MFIFIVFHLNYTLFKKDKIARKPLMSDDLISQKYFNINLPNNFC